jgi:hypothetical protein
MNWNGMLFVLGFLVAVYCARELARTVLSPQFKLDIGQLREQRRRRRCARR